MKKSTRQGGDGLMRNILSKIGVCSQEYSYCEDCPYEDTNKCDFEEVGAVESNEKADA